MIELIFPDGSKRPFDDGVTGKAVATSIAISLAKRAATATLEELATREYVRVPPGFAGVFFDALFGIALTARLDQHTSQRRYDELRRYAVHTIHDRAG